jgi:hypothetical protein
MNDYIPIAMASITLILGFFMLRSALRSKRTTDARTARITGSIYKTSSRTIPTTPCDHWKEVEYIQYKNNILMLKHKDHSFIEYYNDNGTWRKMPGMKKVNNDTVSIIEDYFIKFPKLKQGRGGSKSLG